MLPFIINMKTIENTIYSWPTFVTIRKDDFEKFVIALKSTDYRIKEVKRRSPDPSGSEYQIFIVGKDVDWQDVTLNEKSIGKDEYYYVRIHFHYPKEKFLEIFRSISRAGIFFCYNWNEWRVGCNTF